VRPKRPPAYSSRVKLNRRMGRYLEDLRSREVEAVVPARGPDVHIVKAGGCFLFRGFVDKPHLSPKDFKDQTGLECSANRLRMESMLDTRLTRSCPLLLLTAGLLTARAVSAALARHAGLFNIILSYDGESCTVRFHKLRAGQRWLLPDLEEYVDEGVLVFQAGSDVPFPALLAT
jgi:hypothetical protein